MLFRVARPVKRESIPIPNTFGTYRMTCCRLFCGRLSRLPASRLQNKRFPARFPAVITEALPYEDVFFHSAASADTKKLLALVIDDSLSASSFDVRRFFDFNHSCGELVKQISLARWLPIHRYVSVDDVIFLCQLVLPTILVSRIAVPEEASPCSCVVCAQYRQTSHHTCCNSSRAVSVD